MKHTHLEQKLTKVTNTAKSNVNPLQPPKSKHNITKLVVRWVNQIWKTIVKNL